MTKRSWMEWRLVPPKGDTEYLPFYETFRTRKGARVFQSGNLDLKDWRVIKVKVTEQ